MKKLHDISIGRKFALIIIISTSAAVVLMAAAFIFYDYAASQKDAFQHLATLSKMVANNSTAAVAFGDRNTAAEVLNALQAEPGIEIACTYDAEGELMAQYLRASAQCPRAPPPAAGGTLVQGGAVFVEPVRLRGSSRGLVYIKSDLAQMRVRRDRFLMITIVILLPSLLAGWLLGSVLRRYITTPISELAAVMQTVSQSRDYSLRAESRGSDEIGKLVSGFNHMLTEIQESHGRLKEQALNDELTGLPNRRLFADRLSHALATAQRQQTRVALIYMDLDGFKLVNDTLGHSIGDLLLREVADRLRRRIRASDTFARIGGDEFTVLATSIRNARDAGLIANAMLAEFERPFVIQGNELALTASIGISLYPDDAMHAEEIVQQADTAMYVAKSAGKNQATFFTREHGEVVRERVELEKQLRGALEHGELTAHYQPEFDVATHRLLRFESLARWRHPTLGMIPPLKFIPIAEENGLIVPMGKWMMEQACLAAVRWQALSQHPIGVAVNVTTTQFLQNEFVEMVGGILQATGLLPGLLQLELTESVLMPGHGDSLEKLARLRSLGISLAMDDFGTGYSSLSYLSRLPFDHLKIDRSFLEQIVASRERQTMMRSVVELAHNLKMTVIIEGVETPEQYGLIRSFGCDEVQGFLFGRPTADPDQYLVKNAAIYKSPQGPLANRPACDLDSRAAPRPENAIAEVP